MSISFERIEQFRKWLCDNGLEEKESPLFEWVEVEPDDSYKQPSKGILCINSDRVLSGKDIIEIINSVLNKNRDITEIQYIKPEIKEVRYFAKWGADEKKCEKFNFNVLNSLGTMTFGVKVERESESNSTIEKMIVSRNANGKITQPQKNCKIYKIKYVLKVTVNGTERIKYDLCDCGSKIELENKDYNDPEAIYSLPGYKKELDQENPDKTYYLTESVDNIDLEKINTTIGKLVTNECVIRKDIDEISNDRTFELLKKCLSTEFMKLFTYKTLKHYISPFVKYLCKDGDDKHIISEECEKGLANGSHVVERIKPIISEQCQIDLMNGSPVVVNIAPISEECERAVMNNDKSYVFGNIGMEKHDEKKGSGHTPEDNKTELDYDTIFNKYIKTNGIENPDSEEEIYWLYRMYKYMSLICKQIKKINDKKKDSSESVKEVIDKMVESGDLIKRDSVDFKQIKQKIIKKEEDEAKEAIKAKRKAQSPTICWTDTVDTYTTIKEDVFDLIETIKIFAKDSNKDFDSNMETITKTILFHRVVLRESGYVAQSLKRDRIDLYKEILNKLKTFIVDNQRTWGDYLAHRVAMLRRKEYCYITKNDEGKAKEDKYLFKIKIIEDKAEKYIKNTKGN